MVLRGLIFKVFLDFGAVDDLLVDLRALLTSSPKEISGDFFFGIGGSERILETKGSTQSELRGSGREIERHKESEREFRRAVSWIGANQAYCWTTDKTTGAR